MAALTAENFAALQSLLKASSKDVVRQLCQESFSSSALCSKKLLDITCSSLSVTQEEAEQLLQALHRLTRLAAFRDLASAEAILALFPENFHQNLKNLLTKIILEHVSTWRTEAQANLNEEPEAQRSGRQKSPSSSQVCLSSKSSVHYCESHTFPKTQATTSSSLPVSLLLLPWHLEGWVSRQRLGDTATVNWC
ncbi:COMM domain-containing protein 9 isoform X2 [Pteronotus mesoamericanus]|uniref:COMM domain-containing protein 9 isoform X2 n=1 Tax=Pteronotus mesoamericanus TaxID=1884717 RepID=UPI0023EDA494|nr:COMM domain-containing protein 9 isoform X2 [Pteronotus parnellii mesoamericanus]